MEVVTPETSFKSIPVVQEFSDMFPKEIPGMPPHKEVEFYIDLILGSTLYLGPYIGWRRWNLRATDSTRQVIRKGLNKAQYVTMGAQILFVKKEGREPKAIH